MAEILNTVRTSQNDWLEKAINLFSKKQQFIFIDDANIGITEEDLKSALNLIRAAKNKSSLKWEQIAAILVGIGISGVGIWMIAVAIADPEPTSKLGILLAGGVVLALTGGLGALYSLGIKFNVKAKSDGFEVSPQ